MRARVAELEKAIAVFCAGASWASEFWKKQGHIKPLFDIAAALNKKEGDGES